MSQHLAQTGRSPKRQTAVPARRTARHRYLRRSGAAGVLGALGVVFGDIGTSPLYALSAALPTGRGTSLTVVYGVTSMVVWTITAIVSVLYVTILMRFDNHGEGGILALLARIRRGQPNRRTLTIATALAMVGTGMFLSDGVVTPAISVLSAVEGAGLASPTAAHHLIPIATGILVVLFALQRAGTGRIGHLFGPIMALWFLVSAVIGVISIAQTPHALTALSPHWITLLIAKSPKTAFLALGGVILAATGAEALFADMGHFGRRPIGRAWFVLVYPALLNGYIGQAAAITREPGSVTHPFFAAVPNPLVLPVALLATAATVIASQAVISGAFSVVNQASRLGLLPHLRTVHTSTRTPGQIYLPGVNAILAAAVLGVVFAFQSSAALSSAYGIAVTLTIMMTTGLALVLAPTQPARGLPAAIACLLLVTAAFVAGNVPKIPTGGWLTLVIGAVLCVGMWAWYDGERRLRLAAAEQPSLRQVLPLLARTRRVPGTTIYLTHSTLSAPESLLEIMRHYGVAPEGVVVLHVRTGTLPTGSQISTRALAPGVTAVEMEFGYREPVRVARRLEEAKRRGELRGVSVAGARFALTVNLPVYEPASRMPRLLQRIYILLKRFSLTRVEAFHLPITQTVLHAREFTLR